MLAAILSIIGPLIPYIIGAVAVIALYFGIKEKGVQEQKAREVNAQAKAVEQVKKQVAVAVAKDDAIDTKAQEAKDEVVKDVEKPSDGPLPPGSSFKF